MVSYSWREGGYVNLSQVRLIAALGGFDSREVKEKYTKLQTEQVELLLQCCNNSNRNEKYKNQRRKQPKEETMQKLSNQQVSDKPINT